MNKMFDNKQKQTIKTIMFLIIFAIISYKIIDNIEDIYSILLDIFNFSWRILIPFITGGFIAFFLNSSVRRLEKEINIIFEVKKRNKFVRAVSVTLVYLVALSILSIIIMYLIPTIKQSIEEFNTNLSTNIGKIEELFMRYGYDISIDIEKEFVNFVTSFLQTEGSVSSILTGVVSVTTTLLNIVLGLIISFYILIDKEIISKNIVKFLSAFFNKSKTTGILEFCTYVHDTFDKFIIGKLIDSFIIGVICYVVFYLMNIKYALLFSVIIGITNVIPYFGPFMGGIPVTILVFLYNPSMTIPVGLFILIIQQIDGSIIGPKILGDAIGVRPLSVIFAIIIGGALWGVLGMFIAVPTFVIIADLISKYINKKNKIKLEEK